MQPLPSGPMRFSHTVHYVHNVAASVAFYERALGIEAGFVHPEGDYAELGTGDTKLAFASHRLVTTLFEHSYRESDPARRPIGFELSFEVPDVDAAFERAVAAGADALASPVEHPWGQRVAYVRDLDGAVLALGSVMKKQAS